MHFLHRKGGVSWVYYLKGWSLHRPCKDRSSEELAISQECTWSSRISRSHGLVSCLHSSIRKDSCTNHRPLKENQSFCVDPCCCRRGFHNPKGSAYVRPYSCLAWFHKTLLGHHQCERTSHWGSLDSRRRTRSLWIQEAQDSWAQLPNSWLRATCCCSCLEALASLPLG